MRAHFTIFIDACVLVPPSVCNLYLSLAEAYLFQPRWSEEVLREVHRTHVLKMGWSDELADYWQSEVRKAFPEALVDGYQLVAGACTNDPKDRHVVAAAYHSRSDAIITSNLKHFPAESLTPFHLTVHSPADYLCTMLDMSPGLVIRVLTDIASMRKKTLREQLNSYPPEMAGFVQKVIQVSGMDAPDC